MEVHVLHSMLHYLQGHQLIHFELWEGQSAKCSRGSRVLAPWLGLQGGSTLLPKKIVYLMDVRYNFYTKTLATHGMLLVATRASSTCSYCKFSNLTITCRQPVFTNFCKCSVNKTRTILVKVRWKKYGQQKSVNRMLVRTNWSHFFLFLLFLHV